MSLFFIQNNITWQLSLQLEVSRPARFEIDSALSQILLIIFRDMTYF